LAFRTKNSPKILLLKLNSCILPTLRLENLKIKRARSNVQFEFERKWDFINYTKKYYIFLNKDLYQVTKNVGQIYLFFETLYIELQFTHNH
jgi:hypothetical protein